MLYVLVGVEPFLALGLAYIFIGGFTKPIKVLLDATRKLKGGNLDHRIVGLHDEFGELQDSINEMAGELTGHMKNWVRAKSVTACSLRVPEMQFLSLMRKSLVEVAS